nr:hypothetical protein [Tanacetum cinerariifolium]
MMLITQNSVNSSLNLHKVFSVATITTTCIKGSYDPMYRGEEFKHEPQGDGFERDTIKYNIKGSFWEYLMHGNKRIKSGDNSSDRSSRNIP